MGQEWQDSMAARPAWWDRGHGQRDTTGDTANVKGPGTHPVVQDWHDGQRDRIRGTANRVR